MLLRCSSMYGTHGKGGVRMEREGKDSFPSLNYRRKGLNERGDLNERA